MGKFLNLETNGARRLILAAFIALIGVGGLLLFFKLDSPSNPTLIFKGYEISATNTNAIAKLELRNTTGRDIWLCFSGERFPLRPSFLERPTFVPPAGANRLETNYYSVHAGSIFLVGEKLLPGESIRVELPLRSGELPKQVGVIYYFGRFSSGNDFLSHFGTSFLNPRASLKEKAAFYWQRFREKFKRPEPHEIWCQDLLSFEPGTTNSPPNQATLVK